MESTTYRYRCTESNILSSLNLENLTRENMWFYSRVINTANKFFVSELKIGMNCLIDFIIRINSFNQKKIFAKYFKFFFQGKYGKVWVSVYFCLLFIEFSIACRLCFLQVPCPILHFPGYWHPFTVLFWSLRVNFVLPKG